jgi:hypothetical protein
VYANKITTIEGTTIWVAEQIIQHEEHTFSRQKITTTKIEQKCSVKGNTNLVYQTNHDYRENINLGDETNQYYKKKHNFSRR